MSAGSVFEFGPFRLDSGRRQLARGRDPIAISDRQFDILHALVARRGQVIPKDALIEAAWKDVAVSDNSLEQAISSLRRLLGPVPKGSPYIETLARRGYRFAPAVIRSAARETDDALEALLAPYRGFLEGRAAIETLERDAVTRARAAFGAALAESPDYAPGHLGLANALALAFEATRADEVPDVQALQEAGHHAREACRLASESGEAWATLAFVLSRAGTSTGAIAAGRRAIAIEPDNWRHLVRLAYATWGEERLRTAHAAVKLLPGLALAHWLAATVHVARHAFEEAVRELGAGAIAQDRQEPGGRFGSVGLHLLLGLVCLARGEADAAEEELVRELEFERSGHIYSRQACANTWCAIGALRLRQSRRADAADALERAVERVPGHPLVLAALTVISDKDRPARQDRFERRLAAMKSNGALVELAMARGVVDVLGGRHAEAATRVHAALRSTPVGGSAGWTLPVEPLLQVGDHAGEWAPVLATLRSRAA